MAEPLLTPAETAALLGTNVRTLETWRRLGRGPQFIRLAPKMVRYSPAALDAYLSAHTLTNTKGGRPEPGAA